MTSHFSDSLTDLFGNLRQKLLDGSVPDKMKALSDELISAGLLAKGAAVKSSDPSKIIGLDAQWVFPEIQNLVEEALEVGFPDLITEWAALLERERKVLPSNLLTPIMRYFSKHPELAKVIVPALGPRGFQMAAHFEEFSLWDCRKWQDPLSFKQRAHRKFAFGLWRNQHPDKARAYLQGHFSKMHEEDRKNFIRLILKNIQPEDRILMDVLAKAKTPLIQAYYMRFALILNPEAYSYNRDLLRSLIKKRALKDFQFKIPNDRQFQWSADLVWSVVPPDMITDLQEEHQVFEYLHEQHLELALLDSFQVYPKAILRVNYFKWLLAKKMLTEAYPMEQLTLGMDHTSFNACCLEWLKTQQAQTDMEAFYKATLHHRHFWSDELCQTIVSLGKHADLTSKFDMLAFWQLMAFKMNPLSEFADKLPEENRFHISNNLNYEQVIRFRKFMRNSIK